MVFVQAFTVPQCVYKINISPDYCIYQTAKCKFAALLNFVIKRMLKIELNGTLKKVPVLEDASRGFCFLLGSVKLTVGMFACVSSSRFAKSGVDVQEDGLPKSVLLGRLERLSCTGARFVLEDQLLLPSLSLSLKRGQVKHT